MNTMISSTVLNSAVANNTINAVKDGMSGGGNNGTSSNNECQEVILFSSLISLGVAVIYLIEGADVLTVMLMLVMNFICYLGCSCAAMETQKVRDQLIGNVISVCIPLYTFIPMICTLFKGIRVVSSALIINGISYVDYEYDSDAILGIFVLILFCILSVLLPISNIQTDWKKYRRVLKF